MDRPEFKWPCRNAEAQLTNPVGMAAKSVFQSIIPFKFGTLLSGRNFGSKMIGDLVKTFDIFFCTIFPGMTYKRRFGFQRKYIVAIFPSYVKLFVFILTMDILFCRTNQQMCYRK